MKLFSKYGKNAIKDRYLRYKVFFIISFSVFLLAFFAKFLLIPKIFSYDFFRQSFIDILIKITTLEFVFYFSEFIFGITVYAPFLQMISSSVMGFISGYIVISSFKIPEIKIGYEILIIGFILLSALIFCAFSSFCTQVSLRLFSDGITFSINREENRMFGGSLFNSTMFCNTVNLRFLFSYFLFFISAFAFQEILNLIFAFAFSHFI